MHVTEEWQLNVLIYLQDMVLVLYRCLNGGVIELGSLLLAKK